MNSTTCTSYNLSTEKYGHFFFFYLEQKNNFWAVSAFIFYHVFAWIRASSEAFSSGMPKLWWHSNPKLWWCLNYIEQVLLGIASKWGRQRHVQIRHQHKISGQVAHNFFYKTPFLGLTHSFLLHNLLCYIKQGHRWLGEEHFDPITSPLYYCMHSDPANLA